MGKKKSSASKSVASASQHKAKANSLGQGFVTTKIKNGGNTSAFGKGDKMMGGLGRGGGGVGTVHVSKIDRDGNTDVKAGFGGKFVKKTKRNVEDIEFERSQQSLLERQRQQVWMANSLKASTTLKRAGKHGFAGEESRTLGVDRRTTEQKIDDMGNKVVDLLGSQSTGGFYDNAALAEAAAKFMAPEKKNKGGRRRNAFAGLMDNDSDDDSDVKDEEVVERKTNPENPNAAKLNFNLSSTNTKGIQLPSKPSVKKITREEKEMKSNPFLSFQPASFTFTSSLPTPQGGGDNNLLPRSELSDTLEEEEAFRRRRDEDEIDDDL